MTTNYQDNLGASPGDDSEAPGAKDRAQQAAGSAADETKHVAGVAQEEAAKVASEARDQVRGLLDDAATQVDEQSRAQKSKLTATLRTFGGDLDQMSRQQNGSGPANQLVQQVADQAKTLATHLDGREPRELLDDVRRFARQRPGTFLIGALAAGVVVGRLTRGAKAAKDSQNTPDTLTAARPVQTPTTVGTVRPAPVGTQGVAPLATDIGHAPETHESLGVPGPGRDALVDPLDPSEPVPGSSPFGGAPA